MANLRGELNTDKSNVHRLSNNKVNSRLATWEREIFTMIAKDGEIYVSVKDLNTGANLASWSISASGVITGSLPTETDAISAT